MTIQELAARLVENGWQLEVAFWFNKCSLTIYPNDSTAHFEDRRSGDVSQLEEFIAELNKIWKDEVYVR